MVKRKHYGEGFKPRGKRQNTTASNKVESQASDSNAERRKATAGDLTDAFKKLDLSPEQEAFRHKVEQASKGTPRFLFRFWSHSSGGNRELNTPEKITPLAFLGQEEPFKPSYEMTPKKLEHLANKHMKHHRVKTVYSSWSQSLSMVLDCALAKSEDQQGMHIAILDTSKIDTSSNVILHTQEMSEALFGGRTESYKHKYLIYGVITGPAYGAVSLEFFKPYLHDMEWGQGKTPRVVFHRDYNPTRCRNRIKLIVKAAKVYDEDFAAPVAAHMMAGIIGHERGGRMFWTCVEQVAKALPIPRQWLEDEKIMENEFDDQDMIEAWHGADILRTLVIRKHVGPHGFLGGSSLATAPKKKAVATTIPRKKKLKPKGQSSKGATSSKTSGSKAQVSNESPKSFFQKMVDLVLWRNGKT